MTGAGSQLTCEVGRCAERESLQWVEHPQRGSLLVCPHHREEIRALYGESESEIGRGYPDDPRESGAREQ
jgi:hypothetical protein